MNITPGSDELTTNTSLVTDAKLTLEFDAEGVNMIVGDTEWLPDRVTVTEATELRTWAVPHSYTDPSMSCL